MKTLSDIPVSVLDLATIVEVDIPSDSFRKSLEVAKRVEKLGYNRYWFAVYLLNAVALLDICFTICIVCSTYGHLCKNWD